MLNDKTGHSCSQMVGVNQMASAACRICPYNGFIFSPFDDAPAVTPLTLERWLRAHHCLGRLQPALTVWHRLLRIPWNSLMDKMTVLYRHNGKAAHKGQVARQKTSHTADWCNESIWFVMLTKRASVYSKMHLLLTSQRGSSTMMCLKCQDSLLH